MHIVVILCFIILAIYSCVSWLLPTLLAWLFKRKYHIKLKIGRIGLPKLILRDVNLSRDGYFIQIDEISFSSSFFNSETNKLVSVLIKGFHVTNNVEERRSAVETILKPLLSKQNSTNSRGEVEELSFEELDRGLRVTETKLLDFRDKKLPPSLIMFAQFMGVHITNATVVIHGSFTLEASASGLHADGAAGGPARALVFCANLVDAKARVFKERNCLAEAGLSVNVEGTVKADGPLNVEKIHCAISNTHLSFHDELHELVLKRRRYKRPQVRQYKSEDAAPPALPRLSPIVPKIFSLKIDTTDVTCIDNVTKTDFKMSLNSLHVNSRFSAASVHTDASGVEVGRVQVYVALQLERLRVAAESRRQEDTLLYLDKLKLDAKLEKGVLNLYLILSTLKMTYDHEDVFQWYTSIAERIDKSKQMQVQPASTSKSPGILCGILRACVVQGCAELRHGTLLARLPAPLSVGCQGLKVKLDQLADTRGILGSILRACVVQGCAELRHGTLLARLPAPLSVGCQGLKVKLDQLVDTREEPYTASFPRILLGSRHWSTELLVDSGWATCGTREEAPARKHHTWGAALLAVALVKWGSHGPKDSKVEAMMDCLRLEWSNTIATTLINFVDCLHAYRAPRVSPPSLPSPCQVTVNVALSHINVFLIVSENMCLMTRVDAVTLERSVVKGSAMVSGLKVVDMVPFKGALLSLPSPCQVTVNVALSHINVFLIVSENMCLMTRVDAVTLERSVVKGSAMVSGLKVVDMVPFKGNVQCQRSDEIPKSFFHVRLARIEHTPNIENNSSLLDFQFLETVDCEWSANLHLKILQFVRAVKGFREELKRRSSGSAGKKSQLDWRVGIKGETNLGLVLSKENCMIFATDDMTVSYDHELGLSIIWSQLKMILNGDEVITVEGYSQERAQDDHEVRVERSATEGFVLPWNRVWAVTVDSVRVIFPYKHRFAESVQGDFVSLFKWIKIIHGIGKPKGERPLPSDLHIKIEELLIEMSDDPFEVKLRDNYELLEDEYKESQKRRTMLDAKVQELCKPHLFLPAGKVEELYSALRQKDAQIYVQRCRAAPPPRTRLVACCLSRFQLLALADPSIHGVRALHKLRDIDFDSPWPEDGIEFTTLWCRAISLSCSQWQLLLRDFPQPLLRMSQLRLWGALCGAEEQPPPRAVRTVTINQGEPWGAMELERSMMPLKWYYDLCCEMAEYSYAFGPCWEPVIAQCNLSFDQVSRPSLDPSVPLSWWDKVRLLMHGRLTVNCGKFTCLLHVSLDPYNTTEEMELTWTDLVLDWTNGKLGFLGELNVFVRTASKYDDCRVLRMPALKLSVKLGWQCVGDARDHRAVAPCAPTRLPEYSSNQEHDSYRAFRSQNLDLHISMETKPIEKDGPILLLYGSTLRWFESLKLILSGVTRPTRRGRVFRNVRPRKPQLSRHYREVSAAVTLHNLQVFYWSSSSMQRGIEMLGVRVTCGSKHRLSLVKANDNLVRRPRANWTTGYMNCDLNDAEIWLKTPAQMPEDKEGDESGVTCGSKHRLSLVKANDNLVRRPRANWTTGYMNCDLNDAEIWLKTPAQMPEDKEGDENSPVLTPAPMEKCYCLSVRRVSYGRECGEAGETAPTHRLAVHDLRGAWTKLNRDLAFALIDTYIKAQQLKKNLSTKALKEEERPDTSPKHQRDADVVSPPPAATQSSGAPGSNAEGMLAALVAEAGSEAPVVFSDELSGAEGDAPPSHPHHPRHVLDDENAHTAFLIELVNSQVVLKGCESRGYVILCAARAEVRQRVRRAPAATAWSGALSAMQYYATVSAGDRDQLDENIQWVSVEEISERCGGTEISTLPDVPRLVGSGHSAGGVIGRCVGPSEHAGLAQLQRIVSRCACEFYYVSHDSAEGGGGGAGGWAAPPQPYDSFTLMHHDLDVCTNSLQYAMLLDVVNNVVLHVEPERRRTLERRARVRFQLQLHRDQDPRRLINHTQTQVRESLARLRRLEKEYYLKNRSISGDDPVAVAELKSLDDQVNECKETVWNLGEELDAMVRAWRDTRRGAAPAVNSPSAPPHRYNEICFKCARWRLTDADGQLGIADLLLTNFLYTKTSRSDDSVEHQLEVGYVRVTNLLPNEPFPEVLVPQAPSGRAPLARRAALRVFCRDRPPVGGISVKEHFEVNIVPIRIGLTKKFFNTMLKFCFPERDPDSIEEGEDDEGLRPSASTASLVSTGSKKTKKKGKDSNSNFYVKRDKKDKDDVEKMKERAEKNKLFIYIKIPEVPMRVSYKGSKEKNLEDVRDLPLVLPTLEYHNVTWTWLDLLLATKSDTRRVIVSQAIRQKLQLHRRAAAAPEPHEEDKARLLLGERTVAENKPQKKSTPGVFKFSKS